MSVPSECVGGSDGEKQVWVGGEIEEKNRVGEGGLCGEERKPRKIEEAKKRDRWKGKYL